MLFHGLKKCVWENPDSGVEAKEPLFCKPWSSLLSKSYWHTRLICPLILSTRSGQISGEISPAARRRGDQRISPTRRHKSPFLSPARSNRYFVNGLNDSTQMIDGADGAFAVFPQYQADTLLSWEFDQSQFRIEGKPKTTLISGHAWHTQQAYMCPFKQCPFKNGCLTYVHTYFHNYLLILL